MIDKELVKKEIDELEESIIEKQSDIDSCKKVIDHFAKSLSNKIIEIKIIPEILTHTYNFHLNNLKAYETELHELKDKKIRKVISLCIHSNIKSTKN